MSCHASTKRWVEDEYNNKRNEEVNLMQWEVEFPKVWVCSAAMKLTP